MGPDFYIALLRQTEQWPYLMASSFSIVQDMFQRRTGTEEETAPEWTDKEILALLEGIDMFKEDWSRVRDHVNNTCHHGQHVRAQDDCILTFIRCV